MFEFDAHFYETKIFIGGKKEYTFGEILKISFKNIKGLDDIYHKCKRYVKTCTILKVKKKKFLR